MIQTEKKFRFKPMRQAASAISVLISKDSISAKKRSIGFGKHGKIIPDSFKAAQTLSIDT
ncbi:hypothetical protein YC2023_113310 [Brassica napus]